MEQCNPFTKNVLWLSLFAPSPYCRLLTYSTDIFMMCQSFELKAKHNLRKYCSISLSSKTYHYCTIMLQNTSHIAPVRVFTHPIEKSVFNLRHLAFQCWVPTIPLDVSVPMLPEQPFVLGPLPLVTSVPIASNPNPHLCASSVCSVVSLASRSYFVF